MDGNKIKTTWLFIRLNCILTQYQYLASKFMNMLQSRCGNIWNVISVEDIVQYFQQKIHLSRADKYLNMLATLCIPSIHSELYSSGMHGIAWKSADMRNVRSDAVFTASTLLLQTIYHESCRFRIRSRSKRRLYVE